MKKLKNNFTYKGEEASSPRGGEPALRLSPLGARSLLASLRGLLAGRRACAPLVSALIGEPPRSAAGSRLPFLRALRARRNKNIFNALAKSLLLLMLSLEIFSQHDSLKVLSYGEFIEQVKKYHPIAKQANLLRKQAQANLRYARGNFDPKLQGDLKQKYFQNKEYYSLLNGKLKIPTWYGLELSAGYEQTEGIFRNPENNTPSAGLVYAGVSANLGQGLFIDKRRLALRQAKLFLQMNEAERTLLMNSLLYEASLAYWKWSKAYNKQEIYRQAYERATERFNAVKTYFQLGNRPAMDTLEAGIQRQSRETEFLQAQMEWKNATAKLNVYLWGENQTPLEVAPDVVPQDFVQIRPVFPKEINSETLNKIIANHPKINKLQIKTQQLEWERKWKKEQLKPVLNVKYNPLVEPVGNNFYQNFSLNNYKWAFVFSYPLFLRKERSGIQLTNIKIQNTELKRLQTEQKIKALLISSLNLWETAYQQTLVARQTMENSGKLLEAERTLFEIGESSLFKLNARELKYIKTQVQYLDFLIKTRISELEFLYNSAKLNE